MFSGLDLLALVVCLHEIVMKACPSSDEVSTSEKDQLGKSGWVLDAPGHGFHGGQGESSDMDSLGDMKSDMEFRYFPPRICANAADTL